MVVQRELRAGSRRPVTYWGRFFAAALALFVVWRASQALNGGNELFELIGVTAGVLCVLDGVRRAAAAITEEKSEGTLGLLLLTPLSGSELLYGKFFAVALGALPLALAVIPMFGICLLLGGVSGGEFLRLSLTTLHLLTIAIVVGIFASCNCRTSIGATFVTIVILLFSSVVWIGLANQNFPSPLAPALLVPDIQYGPRAKLFWSSLVGTQIILFSLLWLYGRNFGKRWRREEEFEIHVQNFAARPAIVNAPTPAAAEENYKRLRQYFNGAPKWFTGNPMTWLTLREMNMSRSLGVGVIAAIACSLFALTPIGLFYSFVFAFGLVVMLCIASARTFAVARHNSSVELLIASPLGVEGVIQGHLDALRKMFFWPGLITVATFFLYLTHQAFVSRYDNDLFGPRSAGMEWYVFLGFVLMLLATPWIGMWLGLQAKTPARAILATLATVLILPRLGGCLLADALFFGFLWPFARHRVYAKLGRMVAGSSRQA